MHDLLLSEWSAWSVRAELRELSRPGVYVVAKAETDISGLPFTWLEAVNYTGMTNSLSGLRGRLQQFDNTIAVKRRQHGGADRVRFEFQNVAKCEYDCLAQFVEIHGRLPKVNDKKAAPKYSLTIGRREM